MSHTCIVDRRFLTQLARDESFMFGCQACDYCVHLISDANLIRKKMSGAFLSSSIFRLLHYIWLSIFLQASLLCLKVTDSAILVCIW